MRTKTLLIAAAVLSVGLVASVAQSVYSVNSVGYVNVTLVNGYNLVANPLNGTNNSISTVMPSAPDSTVLYHFNRATQHFFATDTYFFFGPGDVNNGWYDEAFSPSLTVLNPGEGFFLKNPGSSATITFVGDVPQGNVTNTVAGFYGFYSSIVPQAGGITTTLGYNPGDSTVVKTWNPATQHYNGNLTYFFFGPGDVNNGWYDDGFTLSEPNLGVAQGCLIYNPTATAQQWGRTFSVN